MEHLKLYMILLGCTPPGRYTEQHDVFFGIGSSMAELKPAMKAFWPEAPKIHIDAWREVRFVDGHQIRIVPRKEKSESTMHLFFLNLGGYKPGEFDEFHYKILTVADNAAAAIQAGKSTSFYRHTGFKGAESHIDDKYGVDVDDIYNVSDILADQYKLEFTLEITDVADGIPDDPFHLGYVKWDKI